MFRVVLGLSFCFFVFDQWEYIEQFAALGPYRLSYPGFAWVPLLTAPFLKGVFVLIACLGLVLATGWFYRPTIFALLVTFGHFFLLDLSHYNNHYYLTIILLLLMLVLRGDSGLLLGKRGWELPVPKWNLYILRFQILIVYFFGAIAKCNADWLWHAEPMHQFLVHKFESGFFASEQVAFVFAWSGLVFDLLIGPALLIPRVRVVAASAAILFHITNFFIFDIGYFPLLMIGSLVLFLPLENAETAESSNSRNHQKYVCTALAVYIFLQILIPLRPHVYSGKTSWTQQGDLFSWRMKLNAGMYFAEYFVFDKQNKQYAQISPQDYMTPSQLKVFGSSPYHLALFPQFLVTQLPANFSSNLSIYIIAIGSLNGRSPQLIVKPNLDLMTIKPTVLGGMPWVLPIKHDDVGENYEQEKRTEAFEQLYKEAFMSVAPPN